MTGLALRSVRARRAAFTATAITVLLGSAVMSAFLGLLDTAAGPGVSDADQETLVTMASVVGGWGILIVVFAVASTLGLAVRARAVEFSLLRTIGATRRQVRRMVMHETFAVVLISAVAGLLPGWALGSVLVGLISRGGLISDDVSHRAGPLSAGLTLAGLLLASWAGAWFAARRATRGTVSTALAESVTGRDRVGVLRVVAGVFLLAVGATYSVLTVTVQADSADPFAAMQTAGPASVFWGAGLAVLAPLLLRTAAALASPAGRAAPSYLALHHARFGARRMGGVLAPVIFFVATGAGTLTLMAIENSTVDGQTDGETVELLNYVVSGMITVFTMVVVVTTLAAVVADRRREFAVQRLTGFAPAQLTRMVTAEAALIVVVGVAAGGLASLGTSVPYAVVKTDGWFPAAGVWLLVLVAAVAAVVTLGTALAVTRRVASAPVITAAAA